MPEAKPAPAPRLFKTTAALRAWFEKNHDKKSELWMLYYKVGSGKSCVRYQEALDEALCFGWIDTTSKRVDEESYMQRWTPRKRGSNWSAVNVAKAEALIEAGRMTPAGLAAFEARDASAKPRYSFENRPQELPADAQALFRRSKAAWAFWQEQPPGYRRTATWVVVSAKKEETRARRLAQLIACSARRERLPQVSAPKKAAKAAKRS
ncbi:MAG TPA: YdeI/OmpD-associated family protein [Candidatus Thermoplasmatota archaeon]|nr:YdeI/OmpD-associated family protein [Candidatus Thermoplasmatota archaeon]